MSEQDSANIVGKDDTTEDGSNIVTLVEVLKAEELLEENADAVLGPGDDKTCTHNQGYVKRQALYACLTCLPADSEESAGVCLACSYHCHGDHDLVELYTKRNFKCDCGNSKFKGMCCFLDPAKSGINENNVYNQNFKGKYCLCQRPYPDPDDEIEDDMLQCIVCEDWFHSRHLESKVPNGDVYSEMICKGCTDRLPFLQYYLGYTVSSVSEENKNDSSQTLSVTDDNTPQTPKKQVLENDAIKDSPKSKEGHSEIKTSAQEDSITPTSKELLPMDEEKKEKQNTPTGQSTDKNDKDMSKCTSVNDTKTETPIAEQKNVSEVSSEDSHSNTVEGKGCLLKNLNILPKSSGATFWPDNFRKILCSCTECLETYRSLGVLFLVDEGDTITAYEEEGRQRRKAEGGPPAPTQYQRGMEALNSLDRVQQMEAIHGYNELKTNLMEYLSKFAENKKVVREEDIREFFSGMQARKRQKLDIPYHCR